MLLLDKSTPTQTIIVTISELNSIAAPFEISNLVIKVINKSSNKNYRIQIGQNISLHQKRYDEFSFSTSNISNWEEGMYVYEICKEVLSLDGNIAYENLLEIGLLKVIDDKEETFISVAEDNSADDYIIFE